MSILFESVVFYIIISIIVLTLLPIFDGFAIFYAK